MIVRQFLILIIAVLSIYFLLTHLSSANAVGNPGIEITEHKSNGVDVTPGGTTNVRNMIFKFKSNDDKVPLNFECTLIGSNFTRKADCGPQVIKGSKSYNNSELQYGNFTFIVTGIDADTNQPESSSFEWEVKRSVQPPKPQGENPFKMCSPPKEFRVYGFYGASSLDQPSRILYTINGIVNNSVIKAGNFTLQTVDVIHYIKQNTLLANISIESNNTNYLIGVQNISLLSECDFEVSSDRANKSALPHSYTRPSRSLADTNPFLDCGNQSPDMVTYSIIPNPLPKYGSLALNHTKTDILISIYPSTGTGEINIDLKGLGFNDQLTYSVQKIITKCSL
jgi:hypothetical protein